MLVVEADGSQPDGRLLAQERADVVRRALASLDPTCRKLITLLILESHPEIRRLQHDVERSA